MAQEQRILDNCEWLAPYAREALEPVRSAVIELDAANLDPFFTDHSSRHCERVLVVLSRIIEVAGPAEALTETEGLVLGAAAYLHDVGMYYSRSPYETADARRRHHHELSAHLIRGTGIEGAEDFWTDLNLTQLRKDRVLGDIATVALGHRHVNLLGDGFGDARDPYRAGSIRLRLLAALLRLADGLDQDFHRVHNKRTEIQQVDGTSRGHWLKHYFVRQIEITRARRVHVHLSVPPDAAARAELLELLGRATKADVQRALHETDDVLFSYRVGLRFGEVHHCEDPDIDPPTREELRLLREYADEAEASIESIPAELVSFTADIRLVAANGGPAPAVGPEVQPGGSP